MTRKTTAFGILEAIQQQATEAVFVRGRMEPILWPIRGADDWYSFACHVQNHPTSIVRTASSSGQSKYGADLRHLGQLVDAVAKLQALLPQSTTKATA